MDELLKKWAERAEECCRLAKDSNYLKEYTIPTAVATILCIMELEAYMKEGLKEQND